MTVHFEFYTLVEFESKLEIEIKKTHMTLVTNLQQLTSWVFFLNCLQMPKERMWQFEITITFETTSIFERNLMLNIYFFSCMQPS